MTPGWYHPLCRCLLFKCKQCRENIFFHLHISIYTFANPFDYKCLMAEMFLGSAHQCHGYFSHKCRRQFNTDTVITKFIEHVGSQLWMQTTKNDNTFATSETQTWLPDLHLGINPFRIFCAWPVWAEVYYYLGYFTAAKSSSRKKPKGQDDSIELWFALIDPTYTNYHGA